MTKRIGKIQNIRLGFGGYQEAQLGLSVTLGSDKESWGVMDFKGFWGPLIKRSENTQWTEASRTKGYADVMRFVGELLTQAKKEDISQLKGVPVEVTLESNTLKSWRILAEVI